MTATQEFNRARAAFMRRASAPELPAAALKLAYLLAYKHMDSKTGTVSRRAHEELARDLNTSVRSVQRLLRNS